jgi:hypothetical protein
MTPEMLWSAVLTAVLGLVGWLLKGHADEQQRLQVLLNRTREELAKEYVTKAEVHGDINRVILRIEALDAKMDRLLDRLVERTQK